MRRRESGYCEVSTKQGGAGHLQRDQYTQVRLAWTKGVRFVDVVDAFGASGVLKLADVDAVLDVPASAVIARLDEKRADDADDALAGGV